ncbi:MAG: DUF1553 domain-containing protein [Planctomycetota bacterium]
MRHFRCPFRLVLVFCLGVLTGLAQSNAGEESTAKESFFESNVRPLLIEHCLECHLDDGDAGGNLRLDTREGWQRGGDLGPALVPGDADASLLIRAVEYDDSNLQMPPDGKLDARSIETLRKWIDSGAHDPRVLLPSEAQSTEANVLERAANHWAYQPMRRSFDDLPHPVTIDGFVNAKLDESALSAAGPATPTSLLRRMAFDLTGLPPERESLRNLAAFSSSHDWTRTTEFERVVDSLLASPAYAETFARRWMDVARYAESITLRGFVLPNAWRYRDYLIEAYAEDRGFDVMIREQVAGDLLPKDDVRQRQRSVVATGFLAMGDTNLEDQDKTKLEFDHIDEQLETMGRAFLGQTIGCARCHDHKFDPIPTADYYSLAAVFRSTVAMKHSNVSAWIEKPLPLDHDRQRYFDELDEQHRSLQSQIELLDDQLNSVSIDRKSVPSQELVGVVVDDADASFVGSWTTSSHVAGYVDAGYRHDDNSDRGNKTATFEPDSLAAGKYEVRLSYTAGPSRSTRVKVRVFSANESTTVLVNQRRAPNQDGIWVSLGEFPFEEDGLAFVLVSNEDSDGHVIVDAVQFLPVDRAGSASRNQESRRDPEIEKKWKALKARRARVSSELSKRPMYLTVEEGEPVVKMPILVRGVLSQPGSEVRRGFLSAIGDAEHWADQIDSSNSGRLCLANWMADPKNPLTARVYANRVWCWLMGEGLVATENNFGTTGQLPSHPELLDFLATELIQSGWSTKHLVRMIVRSDAYQRRVVAPSELATKTDPDNRWLWSAHSRRLSVEAVCDAMLSVSGELDRSLFGSTIRAGTKSDYNYVHRGVRRSLYQPTFRNSLPPLHEAFDFADASVSTGQRNSSTVATQALAMMNDPWVIERAQRAANRWIEERDWSAGATWSDQDKIELVGDVFLACLGRQPTRQESGMCAEYLNGPDRLAPLIHSLFASIDFRFLD